MAAQPVPSMVATTPGLSNSDDNVASRPGLNSSHSGRNVVAGAPGPMTSTEPMDVSDDDRPLPFPEEAVRRSAL